MFTHIDKNGNAKMVDITEKAQTVREAVGTGKIKMKRQTLESILDSKNPKGDVLAVARIGAIIAAKKTSEIIPLCHNIPIDSVNIDFSTYFDDDIGIIEITSTAKTSWKTGIEMEALTAAASAGLIIYDMCKAADKEMIISEIKLLKKTGGKSGDYYCKYER